MGLHVRKYFHSLSESKDFQEIVDRGIFFVPLFTYLIQDSIVRFHKMTQEERLQDTQVSSRYIYQKTQTLGFLAKDPEVKRVFYQLYDVEYNYLNKQDSIFWQEYSFGDVTPLPSIPMFYLPLATNVYYKKHGKNYLVKTRLGFSKRLYDSESDQLAAYSHEMDTALLALPVKIFQEKYLETRDIYCLAGQAFPLK
jgi:hypothetical protein